MNPLSLLDRTPTSLENYEVLRHLGSGATAEVFQVVDRRTGRSHVLKQMHLANMSDEEKLRAKQEILVMDGVDHQNVVKFHESFSSDTSVDIVMEYCEGGTLEDLIERQRYEGVPFPEDVLIEWMAELLCALACIHSKRILHRDLKTSNIFVTAKNHLKLGDFGVCAILTNANTMAESMIGTPLYFAPEVCDNKAYDERSDVWSLGVVFYEMCTLRRPFEADHLFSLIKNILTEDIAPFSTGLDQQFEEIVRNMLSKDPKDRPTAQELIDVNLNVPKDNPSHPSQKPSYGRLKQQYHGPVLTYEKPWPPPLAGGALGSSDSAAPAAVEEVETSGHCGVERYITDERGRERYRQLLNQTFGASVALPVTCALPDTDLSPRKKRMTSPVGSRDVPGSRSVKKTSTPKVRRSVNSSSSKASKKCGPATTSRQGALASKGVTERDGRSTNLSDTLATSVMDELKMDITRRRKEIFGEGDMPLSDGTYVMRIPEALVSSRDASYVTLPSGQMRSSATVRSSSSFLEDVKAVFMHHTANGKRINPEELDCASQLLSFYKSASYGLS